ncbi:MAG TPA: ribonuclease E inhibitor RraB [Verrucomicrobiae bacterium]|jgi:hypothetical protein
MGSMDVSSQFPRDASGDVFRRMITNGDDISQARMMDFCHIFPERRQALAFTEAIDGRELEVCISYYKPRDMWQTTVKRYLIPTYQDVTDFELSLGAKAELFGGEANGWSCMVVKTKATT